MSLRDDDKNENDSEEERTLAAVFRIEEEKKNLRNEVWENALSKDAWNRIDRAIDTGEIAEPRGPRAPQTHRALIQAALQYPHGMIQMWMETRDQLVDALLELYELKQELKRIHKEEETS